MAFLLNKSGKKCGNILIWIFIIIVSILFSIFATIPTTKKWLSMRTNIIELEESNLKTEEDLLRKKNELDSIEKEFNNIAKDFLKEENALFPKSLSNNNLAKVLELYSLQYSLIDANSYFELSSVSFSKQNSENYQKTAVTMSIKSTKESLIDFIYFIQNNKLPEKLINAQNSSSSLLKNDVSTSKFIRGNVLPIANIQSINSTVDTDSSGEGIQALLNTEIQVNFFSQNINNEQ